MEGTVKWSSNKTDVATVAEDGTVTAVAKGGATITAEVGDQVFTCEVKCIW
ncbi:MAG: Ig-like domain-containing protein [Ruminiclostridium sp.]|nr:Ig-like domain-containing protein [Ruminiclostridium sp.]